MSKVLGPHQQYIGAHLTPWTRGGGTGHVPVRLGRIAPSRRSILAAFTGSRADDESTSRAERRWEGGTRAPETRVPRLRADPERRFPLAGKEARTDRLAFRPPLNVSLPFEHRGCLE